MSYIKNAFAAFTGVFQFSIAILPQRHGIIFIILWLQSRFPSIERNHTRKHFGNRKLMSSIKKTKDTICFNQWANRLLSKNYRFWVSRIKLYTFYTNTCDLKNSRALWETDSFWRNRVFSPKSLFSYTARFFLIATRARKITPVHRLDEQFY